MDKTKTSLWKVVVWILVLVFLWIAVTKFGQMRQIVQVLSAGKWYWIILAILCQIFFYPYYTNFLSRIFKIFKADFGRKNILKVYFASKFTDVALPISTIGKIAIFVRSGKRFNVSPLNVGISIFAVMLFEITAFAVLSFLILFINPAGTARSLSLLTLFILSVILATIIILLLRLTVQKKTPGHFFLWFLKIGARLFGQKKVEISEVEKIFFKIGSYLKNGRRSIWPSFLIALGVHLINIATFAFIFLAFAGRFDIFAVLTGYVAGLLFTIVSITPQGVGVAETVLIATLHLFGLDISTAAVITLAYRGLLYWLPVFIGFYFFSHLELKKDDPIATSVSIRT